MSAQRFIETWLVDFYDASQCEGDIAVQDGKPVKPIETIEIERAYAPSRWARNHALTLGHRLKREVTFNITKC